MSTEQARMAELFSQIHKKPTQKDSKQLNGNNKNQMQATNGVGNTAKSKNDISLQKNIIIKRKRSSVDVIQDPKNVQNQINKKQKQNKQNGHSSFQNHNIKESKNGKLQDKQDKKKQINQSNWEQFLSSNQDNQSVRQTIKVKGDNSSSSLHDGQIYSLTPDPSSFKGITPVVAIDCEMVMCEDFEKTQKHLIARVSIVNYNGHVLLDSYVNPQRRVINYLTWVSGIKPHHIIGAPGLKDIKQKIENILNGRIIVGHSIKNDFEAIKYTPNVGKVRDISKYSFLKNSVGKIMSLKNMNDKFLNLKIQSGQHSSVEDARATILIYKKFEKQIEQEAKSNTYSNVKNKLLSDIKK